MRLDRRTFLVGTGAAALLAACGDSQSAPTQEFFAARFFGPQAVIADGTPQRMPWGLADTQAPLRAPEAPPALIVQLFRDGAPHTERFDVFRRDSGLIIPYYPVFASFDEPGLYDIRLIWDRYSVDSVLEAVDPGSVPVPGPGDPMPAVETPTLDDARGVDPICTRATGTCPFHDVTLAEALGDRRPTVVIVSTPGFCQTAVCGPILEMAIDESAGRDGLTFVHAEVYQHPDENLDDITEIMTELGMLYEPSVYLVDAGGTIVERIDHTVDAGELAEALDRLGA